VILDDEIWLIVVILCSFKIFRNSKSKNVKTSIVFNFVFMFFSAIDFSRRISETLEALVFYVGATTFI
jgi:hypothetical protein